MTWDWSGTCAIHWLPSDPDHYYVRPRNGEEIKVPNDIYPGTVLKRLGLELVPLKVREYAKMRPEKKFDPTGHEQGRLL